MTACSIALLVAGLIVLGLGPGDGRAQPVRQSPGEVVKAALMAANQGHYAAADRYLSIGALRTARELRRSTRDVRDPWSWWTKDGTIQRVEIVGEEMHEWHGRNWAKVMFVSYKVYFADGTTDQSSFEMKQEDGIWKIHFGP